ncbi:MAG: hypothetical protein ACE5KE_01030 [Methanosarcinales archaeon]
MSSMEIHSAGINLTVIVGELGIQFTEKGASNTADFYDHSKGIFLSIYKCLEAIKEKIELVGLTGLENKLSLAISKLKELHTEKYDPDKAGKLLEVVVYMVYAIFYSLKDKFH